MHKRLFALSLSLAVAFPLVARAATFSDDFSSGLNSAYWTVSQTTPNLYSNDDSHGDVELAKTGANPGGIQSIQISLNLAALGGNITGDFSTQIDFSNANIGPSVDQVELHTVYTDSNIFFDVRDNSSGNNVHVWNGNVNNPIAYTSDSGTFSISRVGGTVTGAINGTTIFSESESAPLSSISFILQNQPGSNDFPSVTFDNFSLTAASVPTPATGSLLSGFAALACGFRRRRVNP